MAPPHSALHSCSDGIFIAHVYGCAYGTDYEWDPQKAESNHRKHWVRFAEAVAVFADEER